MAERVSIADIAPTILKAFNVQKPAYMRGEALSARVPLSMRAARTREGASVS